MNQKWANQRKRLAAICLIIPLVGMLGACGNDTAKDTNAKPSTSATASAGEDPNAVAVAGSVQEKLTQIPEISNFAKVYETWLAASDGRQGVLRNPAGVTLMVPDNKSFTDADVKKWTEDLDGFTMFLSAHMHVGAVKSDALGSAISTAAGVDVPVTDGPTIGGAKLVKGDIEASNGVIHVIGGQLPQE